MLKSEFTSIGICLSNQESHFENFTDSALYLFFSIRKRGNPNTAIISAPVISITDNLIVNLVNNSENIKNDSIQTFLWALTLKENFVLPCTGSFLHDHKVEQRYSFVEYTVKIITSKSKIFITHFSKEFGLSMPGNNLVACLEVKK